MERANRLIKFAYLLGAAVDALAALQLLLPETTRIVVFAGLRGPGGARVAGTAAVLMLSWSFLLLWASARPIERRGVLGLTALAVVGLATSNVAVARFGAEPWRAVAPTLAVQAALFFLLFAAFTVANGVEEHAEDEPGSGKDA